MKKVKLKILNPLIGNEIPIPKYETKGSAGLDLRACIKDKLILKPGKTEMIPMGFAMHLEDESLAALVIPRSGLGSKHGIVLGNLVGLIDSDYQGEIHLHLINTGNQAAEISAGDKLVQFLLIPVDHGNVEIVDEVELFDSETLRGSGGFGSTGTN